jgi:hypothetical protein
MIANVVGSTAAPPIPMIARDPISICGIHGEGAEC